jgi:hypothetical protein
VIENQQPGTSQWKIPWGFTATDTGGQVKGYASATGVNKGGNITFYMSVNLSGTCTRLSRPFISSTRPIGLRQLILKGFRLF